MFTQCIISTCDKEHQLVQCAEFERSELIVRFTNIKSKSKGNQVDKGNSRQRCLSKTVWQTLDKFLGYHGNPHSLMMLYWAPCSISISNIICFQFILGMKNAELRKNLSGINFYYAYIPAELRVTCLCCWGKVSVHIIDLLFETWQGKQNIQMSRLGYKCEIVKFREKKLTIASLHTFVKHFICLIQHK